VLQLDVTDESSISSAAEAAAAATSHLDLLINATGILHIPGQMSPGKDNGEDVKWGGQRGTSVCLIRDCYGYM
jgi:NAD(P)-dependent dehydrogenase (short-subunit alcohol dehydrogenase family)